ncbi:MAG: hypothetical protein OXC81_06710 [Betaproteobacteria bacterium]|nr:hypothetical protein [Betaproteobacteria bacterium]
MLYYPFPTPTDQPANAPQPFTLRMIFPSGDPADKIGPIGRGKFLLPQLREARTLAALYVPLPL